MGGKGFNFSRGWQTSKRLEGRALGGTPGEGQSLQLSLAVQTSSGEPSSLHPDLLRPAGKRLPRLLGRTAPLLSSGRRGAPPSRERGWRGPAARPPLTPIGGSRCQPGPARPRPGPAPARPAPGRLRPRTGDPAARRAAPPGASLRLHRRCSKRRQGYRPPRPLTPRSLRGSVYPPKYLMVIASRGREPAPAPGGATRASRDRRGAASRRCRRDGGHPSLSQPFSAPFCVRHLGGGRQGSREGGLTKPQGRARLQASPVPWQKFLSSSTPRVLGRGRSIRGRRERRGRR